MNTAQATLHQYIERETGKTRTEKLYGDRIVSLVYSTVRESAPFLFKLLTSARMSDLLAYYNYDWPLSQKLPGRRNFLSSLDIDPEECFEPLPSLDSARKIFERKIRYWEKRPMDRSSESIVSPCDAKVLVGSLDPSVQLFIKDKFFQFEEMIGSGREKWLEKFSGGDFALFRLTPEKYHYNHAPVTGRVVDFYTIDGGCHACNPSAVIAFATPHSKNKRSVTVLDTDIPHGAQVGHVAMIEVAALMIGDVVQCYSSEEYKNPQPMFKGLILDKGQPKSLFRPGSSTTVLFFEKGRVEFSRDLVQNMNNTNVNSRFTAGFGKQLVETDIRVRSTIAGARSLSDNIYFQEV